MKRALSTFMFVLLLVSTLAFACNTQNVRASEPILIRADGSIDPPDAPITTVDKTTYTLTGNITSSYTGIWVERDSIVIDGAGYTIQGSGVAPFGGITLICRTNVTIENVRITAFSRGIILGSSKSNTISGNNITANDWGIDLSLSNNNTISGNNVGNNWFNIGLDSSSNNKFHHNSLIKEDICLQVLRYGSMDISINIWDDGYPSGGNYWSDYAGVDEYSGPNQDKLGSDGIGDTPHVIDADNADHYPLMIPWDMQYPYYDWPMFHHNAEHTGYSASIASNNNKTHWTSPVEYAASPAISHGKVIACALYGNAYALNLSTGSVIWDTLIGGQAYVSPAVGEGKAFVGYISGGTTTIWALDEATGSKIWSYTIEHITGVPQHIAPTYADGKVFIGPIADEKIYALNATTGQLAWTFATGDAGSSPQSNPAVAGDMIFVGSQDFRLYALNVTTGMQIWNFSTGGRVTSSPAVSNGMIFVGSSDGKLYAVNKTTGAHIWNSTHSSVTSSPAVADGMVFVGFEAFSATTGALIWNNSKGSTSSSPAVADNKVFVASDGGSIFALDMTTGEEIWSYKTQTSRTLYSSPAVAYDRVFVGLGSTLYAFGVHDINVTDVKLGKTVVGQNFTMTIYVNITNNGGYTESIDVTAFANASSIQTQTTTFGSGTSTMLNFTWNTTGFALGNYTISAIADTVLGETGTSDNSLADGWVFVSVPGDVNGDKYVNIKDAVLLGVAFGSWQGQPTYDPNADINGDGYINIKDPAIQGAHFGEHW